MRPEEAQSTKQAESSGWDHSSHERFFEYYAHASQSQATLDRFISIRNAILRVIKGTPLALHPLEVADIGCGAGTQCMLWGEMGHHVHGLDLNEPLLQLARERAASSGHTVDFRTGSATELPWPNQSIDVCLMQELLEHVSEWQQCLNECVRVLKQGGILFLTTSNKLCPAQSEFNLPLYSWYPAKLKRYFEKLATTTKPQLANFAKYPAVNWFSFYSLRTFLADRGMRCMDRFDLMDLESKRPKVRFVVKCIRHAPLLRWFAHVGTEGTIVLGIKAE